MKKSIFTLLLAIYAAPMLGQEFYSGLERMCWKNKQGKIECYDAPRKWYHENLLLIENDSIFIYKVPLQIKGKEKLYSASDGAFYYYYGSIKQAGSVKTAYLTRYNCDYCGTRTYLDTATGYHYPLPVFDTLKVTLQNGNIKLGEVLYSKSKIEASKFFPPKSYFYFDSNSISRYEPKEQYGLISQAIKDFLQTGDLKLDGDTLRICTDRFDDYEEKNLIETFNPHLLRIDTTNIVFQFYTTAQLNNLVRSRNKPIRIIKINEIIEYWKAARISLTYKILLPKNIHHFSERELSNLFEYDKVEQRYIHIGKLPTNNWGLVEQK